MSAAPGLPIGRSFLFRQKLVGVLWISAAARVESPKGSVTNRRKAIGEPSTPQPFPPNYLNALFLSFFEPAKDGVQCISAILDGFAGVDLTGAASPSL